MKFKHRCLKTVELLRMDGQLNCEEEEAKAQCDEEVIDVVPLQ